MRKLVLFIFLLGCGLYRGEAQLLSVTATLTDSDGQTWNNGSCSIQVYNSTGNPSYYNGVPVPMNPTCAINSSGVLSASLYNTSTLAPASSQYLFTIQSQTSAAASTFLSPVTSSNMSSALSALITAPRFTTAVGAFGYLDVEATPTFIGGFYYNVTNSTSRQCTVIVVNACTTWQNFGGGGIGYPSGTGIPEVTGGASWGTTYNVSNTIPANFVNLASPTAIGGTTPAAGTFTTLVPEYIGPQGSLAIVWRDASSIVRKVEIFANSSISDYGSASTTGSIAWAVVQLGTNGGDVLLHAGTYPVLTSILVDWDWITIEGTASPWWSCCGVAYPVTDTPGDPGGALLVTASGVNTFTIGNTVANMHGNNRHQGLTWRRLNFYGQYAAYSAIVDLTAGQIDDGVTVEDNFFQGFEHYALIEGWDSHTIRHNSFQSNDSGCISETGGYYGIITGNICYDNNLGILIGGGQNTIVAENQVGNICTVVSGSCTYTTAGIVVTNGTGQIYGNTFGSNTTPLHITGGTWSQWGNYGGNGGTTGFSANGTSIPASVTLTQTICSGTVSLGTSAIASGAAATTVTATCTGLRTTDNISLDFNGSPLAVTGYVPAATGMLTIIRWPALNTLNVSVINNTSSSITPGAITLNYLVVR